MHPVKLIERATSTAVHALRHPVSSAAYTAGIARGVVGAVFHGPTDTGRDTGRDSDADATSVPTQRAAEPQTTEAPRKPQRVVKPVPRPEDLEEPIVIEPADEEPGEAFATEPKAVSRESAHGAGPATDAEIDAWIDEAMARDVDVETPVGTTGAGVGHNPSTAEADLQQPLTQPLLDPSVAKAIRSESEIMRKDAERNPE